MEDAAQNTVQGVTGTLSSLARLGQQSPNVTPPKMIVGGTPTVHGSTGTGSATPASVEADPTTSESSVVTPPASEVVAAPIAPTTPAAWVPSPVPAVPDVVVPVSNVIAAVVGSVASTPALLVSLPTSATPVADVIASLQSLLTSVTNAGTPLTQLPSDLADLLAVGTVVPGTTTGTDRFGPSAATEAPTAVQMPRAGAPLPFPLGFEAMLAPGDFVAPAAPLDVTTAGTTSGVASSAPVLAPYDDSSVLSTVKRVIGVIVATVSLAALAAVALPGILGLLGSCAAGIRIGYRQAKAGSELPATAIARFVGSGPIGVVRSGSQISMRPRVVRSGSRAVRAVTPAASSSVRLLDRAV